MNKEDFYGENFKILQKDLKEDLLIWRDLPFSWMRQLSMRKQAGLSKSVSLVQLLKLPVGVFEELDKHILKCM